MTLFLRLTPTPTTSTANPQEIMVPERDSNPYFLSETQF